MNYNKKTSILWGISTMKRKRDRLPWSNDIGYSGVGGSEYHSTDTGVKKIPVVFVHGNTGDSSHWDKHMKYLVSEGYRGDELWSITFNRPTSTHDEMSNQLEHFVKNVLDYTDSKRISIVSHSLGVTGSRYWMYDQGRKENVKSLICLAGANHGITACKYMDKYNMDFGIARPAGFIRSDYDRITGHPLSEMNSNTSNDDVRYYTLRGKRDRLFQPRDSDSPMLEEAEENLVIDQDHSGVRTSSKTKSLVGNWLENS